MASDFKLGESARNAALNAIAALCDSGGIPTLEIYEGTIPATPQDAIGADGLLLTEAQPSGPSFAAAAVGSMSSNAFVFSPVSAIGTASFFRVRAASQGTVFQGTTGEASDTPDMLWNLKNFQFGSIVTIGPMVLSIAE